MPLSQPLNYLPLIGGSVTGPIALPSDPVSALQAATKQYADATAKLQLVATQTLGSDVASTSITLGSWQATYKKLIWTMNGFAGASASDIKLYFDAISTINSWGYQVMGAAAFTGASGSSGDQRVIPATAANAVIFATGEIISISGNWCISTAIGSCPAQGGDVPIIGYGKWSAQTVSSMTFTASGNIKTGTKFNVYGVL